ncbi:hypothetical protein niasHT_029994 [Heterodera trifolii]|uniref:Uncharacterized protein n=1 Tax=Heterodera trifolii TaxID=157864 RepID=A0ABD2JJN0_9BILA
MSADPGEVSGLGAGPSKSPMSSITQPKATSSNSESNYILNDKYFEKIANIEERRAQIEENYKDELIKIEGKKAQIEENYKDQLILIERERNALFAENNAYVAQQHRNTIEQLRMRISQLEAQLPASAVGERQSPNNGTDKRTTAAAAPNIHSDAQSPSATDTEPTELPASAIPAPSGGSTSTSSTLAPNYGTDHAEHRGGHSSVTLFAERTPTSVASVPAQSLPPNVGTRDQLMAHSSDNFAERPPPAQSLARDGGTNFGQHPLGHSSGNHFSARPPTSVDSAPAHHLAPNYGNNNGQHQFGHNSGTHFVEDPPISAASVPTQHLAPNYGTNYGRQFFGNLSGTTSARQPNPVASVPAPNYGTNYGQQSFNHPSGNRFAIRPPISASSVPAQQLAPNYSNNYDQHQFGHHSGTHLVEDPLISASSVPTQHLAPNYSNNYDQRPLVHPFGNNFAARSTTSAASAPRTYLPPNYSRNSHGQWDRPSSSATFHPYHRPPQ